MIFCFQWTAESPQRRGEVQCLRSSATSACQGHHGLVEEQPDHRDLGLGRWTCRQENQSRLITKILRFRTLSEEMLLYYPTHYPSRVALELTRILMLPVWWLLSSLNSRILWDPPIAICLFAPSVAHFACSNSQLSLLQMKKAKHLCALLSFSF